MRPDTFRNAFVGLLLSLVAALLGACGGGAATSGNGVAQGGILNVNGNATATAYAGVPFTMTITGGKAPYVLTSSEPSLISVPTTTSANTVTFVPNNPSTIDTGLTVPPDLPVKSVTITVRDNSSQTASNIIKVAQNYLIGYGISLTPTTCPPTPTGANPFTACSGGETALRFLAATNGTFAAGRNYTITNIKGNYTLKNPATGQTGTSVQAVADSTGGVLVIVQVPANTLPQIGVVRIQDTATGQYADDAFLIGGVAGSSTGTGALTVLPNQLTFTGALTTECGTGVSTVLVYDGTPPYTAISTDQNVRVTPVDPNGQPGIFQVAALNPNICLSKVIVAFTDAAGRRQTLSIDTKPGTTTPPPLTVSPTTVTVACGQTATLAVVGGIGPYSAASTHPRLVPFIQGNILGIGRLVGDGATVYAPTGTITVTDGTSIASVTVNTTQNCP